MSETISSGITLTIPTLGQVNWDQILKTQCFTPISSHNHTGGGAGVQLGTSALQDDAINDTKVLLRNNQWLRGRNAANSADVNILRINTSNLLEFTAGAITGASLAAGAVTTAKVAAGAIVTAGLGDASVSTAKLIDLAVTAAKIANATITATQVASKAITTAKLADGAVTNNQILAGAVAASKIADAGTAIGFDVTLFGTSTVLSGVFGNYWQLGPWIIGSILGQFTVSGAPRSSVDLVIPVNPVNTGAVTYYPAFCANPGGTSFYSGGIYVSDDFLTRKITFTKSVTVGIGDPFNIDFWFLYPTR